MSRVSNAPFDGFLFTLAKWAGIYSDFNGGLQATDPNWNSAVSIGVVADSGLASANHPGQLALSTGASATGFATLFARALNWCLGVWDGDFYIRTPGSLSAAGQRYTIRVGFLDNATATAGVDGFFFSYVDNANGGKWLCVSRAASVDTTADSGIAVVATTHYRLRIVTNATLTQAQFFINGALVATVAGGPNLPSIRPTCSILKSVGATDITGFLVDAIRFAIRLTR